METQQTPKAGETTKSSPPKWLLWVSLAVAILIIAGVLFANRLIEMGREALDNYKEDTVEIVQEPTWEQGEEVIYLTWSSMGIPSIFPEYNDGKIAAPYLESFAWKESNQPNFVTIYDTSEEAIEEYVNGAVESGWQLQWEREVLEGDISTSWAIITEEDGITYSAVLTWQDEEEPYLDMLLVSTSAEQ
jgi:hypothetical protein